jgi:DNA-directed RNA polymerase specialized sigma24 family protein
MFHDWDLTQEEFDCLLAWLHPDQEVAAQKYEDIRRRVRKTIASRGCPVALEIFDETVYRIARKLPALLLDYEGDPALYFYGVANLVHLEYQHNHIETEALQSSLPAPTSDDIELEYECLEECLNKLKSADKEALLQFYRDEKRAKIENRKEQAKDAGVTDNALRLRLFRLRQKLASCLGKCLAQKKI